MLCLFCTVTQWRMNSLKRNSPYIKLLITSLCIFSWVLVSEVSDVMFGDIFFLSWLSVVLGVFFNVVDTVKLTGLCCSTNCHMFFISSLKLQLIHHLVSLCFFYKKIWTCSSTGKRLRRQFPPCSSQRKNWCYLSQEAAQLDREDPVKTWDHLIMPLSFPDLDFEQMSLDRSHTAPEKSTVRIYYSPPSARRVQLAQLKQSPGSVDTPSPWCTPPTSFSQLCLGSSANLSDDMKEMTAGWRQKRQDSPQEKRERLAARGWVDVSCSGTQTHMKPQMVSVGQQTDATQGLSTTRSSPSRALNSPLVSARSHHISASLEGITGRGERSRHSTSSPKLYRRQSLPSPSNLSSSSSSSTSRDRSLWNLAHQNQSGLAWTRQTSSRAGAGQSHSSLSNAKLPTKSTGANRYGLVTEFLRRVSGRADKPVPGSGQKAKSSTRNLERVPTRPPAAPLNRNDSVTRIVNQRFMKQREEATKVQKEEKGSSLNQGVKNGLSTVTAEVSGNYTNYII